MKRYCMEAFGVFFLVLMTAFTENAHAIAMIYMACIYLGKNISGSYFNPAITLTMFMRGVLSRTETLNYMAAQIVGGFLAACTFYCMTTMHYSPDYGVSVPLWTMFFIEALFATVLCAVAATVLTGKTYSQVYGLVLGFTLMAVLTVGAYANPAISVGPMILSAITQQTSLKSLLLFIVGPLVGGAAAALCLDCCEKGKRKRA